MVQEIIIFIVFALAAGYMLRQGYKSFFSKETGCAKGCGGACSTIDLAKIQREMEAKKISVK
ncbi:FeoB-associated Cys-rich membrane protein [Rufibacter psychrotolerans]|uniref:FeoB-associated Cys-rich membrane protein n=1 Tax=Rufibacter psychrotolerans TaxID=2812556 RepID=UPI0019681D2E|nr:FeoB-associated Cys-rich membrane protein [Rufibacter sp. SYSU D00308]